MKKFFIISGILSSFCIAQENFVLPTQVSNTWSSMQVQWPRLSTPLILTGCSILAVYAGYQAIMRYHAHVKKNALVEAKHATSSSIPCTIYTTTAFLPHDILALILENMKPPESFTIQENKLEKNSGENILSSCMLIPYTIRKISFIKPHPHKYWSGPSPDFFISWKKEYSQKDTILPEVDMRMLPLRSDKKFNKLHLNIDSERITRYCYATHIRFLIKNLGNAFVTYDGFNIYNIALVTTTTQSEHLIYLLEKDIYSYKKLKELPLLQSNRGYLRSCMLYPNENKILCTVKNENQCSSLSLYEINTNEQLNSIATTVIDHLFKKTVYLGLYYKNKESYLGLTEEGKLALIYLNGSKKKFEYFLITHYDKLTQGKIVERAFIDIAVDESVKEKNIRYRIALLDTHNEVFICDLRAFYVPTILRVTEKSLPSQNDTPFRLLYDNHKYGIIWKDNGSHNLTRVTVFPDNFEETYVKILLKYTKYIAIKTKTKVIRKKPYMTQDKYRDAYSKYTDTYTK